MSAGLVGLNIAAPGVGAVVTIFLAGLMISAVAIVWFSLLIARHSCWSGSSSRRLRSPVPPGM